MEKTIVRACHLDGMNKERIDYLRNIGVYVNPKMSTLTVGNGIEYYSIDICYIDEQKALFEKEFGWV